MRVLVAPDKFAGTLTAVQAADAIAAGWRAALAVDEVDLAPMSDGGPGFVDVLHASLGGELLAATVSGPYGDRSRRRSSSSGRRRTSRARRPAGGTWSGDGDAEDASTYGVGRLVAAAIDAGARRIVVGLGGSGTNDGGAGLLAALGATAPAGALDAGPRPLAGLSSVDLAGGAARLAGVELSPPPTSTTRSPGCSARPRPTAPRRASPRTGWSPSTRPSSTSPALTDRRTALEKGAGAAGGLGFALLLLGATRVAGDRPGRRRRRPARPAPRRRTWCSPGRAPSTSPAAPARCRTASPRSPWTPSGRASPSPARCSSGSREMRALGVESAYSVVDLVGEEARSRTRPERSPTSPSGSPAPGPAEPASGPRGNNQGCATIDGSVTTHSRPQGADGMTEQVETPTETRTDEINLAPPPPPKVKSLLDQEGRDDLRLRLAVQPGGCSGLRYQLFFDERDLDGDIVSEFGGVGWSSTG